eukprot:1158310-Pelagomonas_calceolata.AAC.13
MLSLTLESRFPANAIHKEERLTRRIHKKEKDSCDAHKLPECARHQGCMANDSPNAQAKQSCTWNNEDRPALSLMTRSEFERGQGHVHVPVHGGVPRLTVDHVLALVGVNGAVTACFLHLRIAVYMKLGELTFPQVEVKDTMSARNGHRSGTSVWSTHPYHI